LSLVYKKFHGKMSRVPAYFVTVTEFDCRPPRVRIPIRNGLRRDSQLRNRPRQGTSVRAYVVQRVVRDPSGGYDGLIDDEQWIASG
jgi:hypothetical protein